MRIIRQFPFDYNPFLKYFYFGTKIGYVENTLTFVTV